MSHRSLFVLIALLGLAPAVQAAPTPAQLCESAMELASAKYAQCRLNAEQKYSKSLDAGKRTSSLAKCSTNLSTAFTKATIKYGVACAATEPSSAFDEYLKQCSDDAAAAAAGALLPDYVGAVAICNANLATCDGDLVTCTADLATAAGELATCEDDLTACEALSPAPLLKTGQTTSYGAGTDGDLQLGVAHGYVDNGDGTVTDTKTGLMWEKKSDDGSIHDMDNTYSWRDSPPYAMNGTVVTTFLATLNVGGGFAGHSDWRIPNRKELESLVNLEVVSPATFVEFNNACVPDCTVTTCSCTASNFYYWSSSTYAGDPQLAWIVSLDDGTWYAGFKDGTTHVRAVRGGS